MLAQVCAGQTKTFVVAGFNSAALSKAFAQAKPGDTVKLPAGTFTITEPIKLRSGVRVIGAGQGQTLVHFTGAKPGVMINVTGCEDAEIADLALDAQNNPNVSQGIAGSNARRLKLHHLTIRNLAKSKTFGPHGILFNGTNPTGARGVTDSEVSDCLIENIAPDASFGCGMRFSWGSSSNLVLRNTIRNTGRGGIFGDNGSADLIIRSNTVTGSGGEGLGIEVWEHCDRAVIEDNRIDHWLSIGGNNHCATRRNVISDKSGVVKFIGLEAIGAYGVYTDNLVDGGQEIGFSVSNNYTNNFDYWANNIALNCVQWAAQWQGDKTGIKGHYFYRCKFNHASPKLGKPRYPGDAGHGFRFNGGVRQCVFEECEFSENDGYGIQFGGADIDGFSFLRSTIRGNKGPAMVGLRDYTLLEWIDCKVEGNKSDAMRPAKPFPHAAPVAAFELPASVRVGESARFVSASRAVEGRVATVLWDFADGAPSTAAEATHIYAQPGDYRVTLIAWDESGRGARMEKHLHVVQ